MPSRLHTFLFTTPPRVAFARPWPGTRRGLLLWIFSLVVAVVGAANYIGTNPPLRTREALSPAFALMPPTAWGCVFVVAGLFSAAMAYCHYDRDQIGYRLLGVLTGFWALVYFGGFLNEALQGDFEPRILASSVIWVGFCAALTVGAAFPKIPLDFGRRDRAVP